jgi:hypothetical protein
LQHKRTGKLEQFLKKICSFNINLSQNKNKKLFSNTVLEKKSRVLISTIKPRKNGPGIFDRRYVGPFTITAKVSPDTCRVKLLSGVSKRYNI